MRNKIHEGFFTPFLLLGLSSLLSSHHQQLFSLLWNAFEKWTRKKKGKNYTLIFSSNTSHLIPYRAQHRRSAEDEEEMSVLEQKHYLTCHYYSIPHGYFFNWTGIMSIFRKRWLSGVLEKRNKTFEFLTFSFESLPIFLGFMAIISFF